MSAPFRLVEGVWLADSDLLLPWLTSRDALIGHGAPLVREYHDGVWLTWPGQVLGRAGRVQTHLGTGQQAAPRWYHAPRLTHVDIAFDDAPGDPRAALDGHRTYLTPLFGHGHEALTAGGYPSVTWDLPCCSIVTLIGERMGDYCLLRIVHADYR